MKRYFRIRHKLGGWHVHCRLFVTTNPNGTWQKCGDIIMDDIDFAEFRAVCPLIEFKPEED